MKVNIAMSIACLLVAAAVSPARAAEYFVGTPGDDAYDGLSRERAFHTVQKGVAALQPGDTLTILPGEYFGNVYRENLGGPDRETVIRAAIPGTVLLRGDLPAPVFEKVPGYRFVYAADFDREVQAVNEVDTLTILETTPNLAELEFLPGGFHYDRANRRLYLSASDLEAPEAHSYTISVIQGHGLYLLRPQRTVIDGLAASGFNCNGQMPWFPAFRTVAGIMLAQGNRCVVRNSVAFFNGGGIILNSEETGGDNIVEDCRAFANYSKFSSDTGNIQVYCTNGDTIRRCRAHTGTNGIRFYAQGRGVSALQDNVAWSHIAEDIRTKCSSEVIVRNCVATGVANLFNLEHCIVGNCTWFYTEETMPPGNILLAAERIRWEDEFADPVNLDFRLQPNSRFRSAGPAGSDRGAFPYAANIFYIRPDGDDANDGLSAGKPWRTLARALKGRRPGDTIYLEGGAYKAPDLLTAGEPDAAPIRICGRGEAAVTIEGDLRLRNCAGIAFERLAFAGRVAVDGGRRIGLTKCRFLSGDVAVRAESVAGLVATHCLFAGGALELNGGADLRISGNVFSNHSGPAVRVNGTDPVAWSDYNGYENAAACWSVNGKTLSLDALRNAHDRYSKVIAPGTILAAGGPLGAPIGIHREVPENRLRLVGPFVHSVSSTTANIEWWTSGPAQCQLAWGDTPACDEKTRYDVNRFGSFSLTGLLPGKTYYFRILSLERVAALDPGDCVKGLTLDNAVVSFATAAVPHAPVEYYVAADGSDDRSGLDRGNAWRTLNHAAASVLPGDTVLIAGGAYEETVRIRATGEEGAPITFRCMPGERVTLDGGESRVLDSAFRAGGKNHLHFDGLYFVRCNLADGDLPAWFPIKSGVFVLTRTNDVRITRCFMDGRGAGYCPGFVSAAESGNLTIRNCVITRGFNGLHLSSCPDLRIENNVFLRNQIQACIVSNSPEQKVYLSSNIFTDSLPIKDTVQLFEIPYAESVVESNNCYYLRMPDAERTMFYFYKSLGRIGLEEYKAKVLPSNSFIADPDFRLKGAILERLKEKGVPAYLGDAYSCDGDEHEPLDFDRLFATNPELVRRKIGLVPEDFRDFAFDAAGR